MSDPKKTPPAGGGSYIRKTDGSLELKEEPTKIVHHGGGARDKSGKPLPDAPPDRTPAAPSATAAPQKRKD